MVVTGPHSDDGPAGLPGLALRPGGPEALRPGLPAPASPLGLGCLMLPPHPHPVGLPVTALAPRWGQQTLPFPRAHLVSWPQPFSLDRRRQWGARPAGELARFVNHAFRALCDAEMKDI